MDRCAGNGVAWSPGFTTNNQSARGAQHLARKLVSLSGCRCDWEQQPTDHDGEQ